MKTKSVILIILFLSFMMVGSKSNHNEDWGFYGHQLINKMAVFTLPGDLIEYYKSNLDYITSHSVDPDKRRYAVRGEAIKHYIDLDHWSQNGVSFIPEEFTMAMIKLDHFYYTHQDKKMLLFDTLTNPGNKTDSLFYSSELILRKAVFTNGIAIKDLRNIFTKSIMPFHKHDEWKIPAKEVNELLPFVEKNDFIEIEDRLSQHGILPYNLEKVYHQLIDAFKSKSKGRILRLSADIGHYVGDAHVPLHTSQNYNGQLTNQDGIHAFWESRIPELFAESEFDFVVGPATYISDIRSFIWKIIAESNREVSLVLNIEKSLSQQTSADQQYCYDERQGVITKIQCKEYAKRYHELLDYQVEERMRASIVDLGSIWMSAWVDAGQPVLKFDKDKILDEEIIKQDTIQLKSNGLQIREHE